MANGGERAVTKMRDGDILLSILKTGVCRLGRAYLTLGGEEEDAYLLYVGMREFDHVQIWYPKISGDQLDPLRATEYHGSGFRLGSWLKHDSERLLSDLIDDLCAIDARRHHSRLSAMACDSLLRKGLVPSGRRHDWAYYHRCVKSAHRALSRVLQRRRRLTPPGAVKGVLERLLAGVPLEEAKEKDPILVALDREIEAIDRGVRRLRDLEWESIPPSPPYYRPCLSEWDD